jgi:hypothetical protein
MAEERKAHGNALFARGKFSAASEAYTEGLALLPAPASGALASVLLTNRAMCAKALGRLACCEADARAAVGADTLNAKAHYLIGVVLARGGDYAAGLARLERALDMAKRQKKPAPLLREFEAAIAAARCSWHEASAAAEAKREARLRALLSVSLTQSGLAAAPVEEEEQAPDAAMQGDSSSSSSSSSSGDSSSALPAPPPLQRYTGSAQQLPSVDDDALKAGGSGGGGSASGASSGSSCSSSAAAAAAAAAAAQAAPLSASRALADLFEQRAAARSSREIPAWALCPVSFEPMLDPVVGGAAGQSFERSILLACLKVKEECPVTRSPLSPSQLLPNVALKAAIGAWLADNPWAHPLASAAAQAAAASAGAAHTAAADSATAV